MFVGVHRVFIDLSPQSFQVVVAASKQPLNPKPLSLKTLNPKPKILKLDTPYSKSQTLGPLTP